MDQVVPAAIIDGAGIAIDTETIGAGSIIKRKGPTAIDASAPACPLSAVGGGKGEPGAERRVDGVGEEGQVAAAKTGWKLDQISHTEIDLGAELQIGPDAQGDIVRVGGGAAGIHAKVGGIMQRRAEHACHERGS